MPRNWSLLVVGRVAIDVVITAVALMLKVATVWLIAREVLPVHPGLWRIFEVAPIGFLAESTERAAEDFFPGYAHTFTEIGKERGWAPTTRGPNQPM